jgi:hypothetical protein
MINLRISEWFRYGKKEDDESLKKTHGLVVATMNS